MAKHRMTVEEHYSVGRVHPRGKVVDDGAERSIGRSTPMESAAANRTAHNTNTNQDSSDFHDRKYNNDVTNNWIRGGNENATTKPGFDKSQAWRQKDGSIHSELSDTQPLRKPVGEKR